MPSSYIARLTGGTLDDNEAKQELERLLADPRLELPQRGRACLRYLADAKFRGETKADTYAMATELFNRRRDFSPVHDPIVRIEVARLRRALESYYVSHGATLSAQIIIPYGDYIPRFAVTETKHETFQSESVGPQLWEGTLIPNEGATDALANKPARHFARQWPFLLAGFGAILAIIAGLVMSISLLVPF